MFPTLQALKSCGGSGTFSAIMDKVIELAELTPEQLAVDYPEGSTLAGRSKILHRQAWARSYLKKLGAVRSEDQGVLAITPVGELLLKAGEGELLHREHELRVGKRPRKFLEVTAEKVREEGPLEMPVRHLLDKWEVKRRGSEVVARIHRDLAEKSLHTEPRFDQVALDDIIRVQLLDPKEAMPEGPAGPEREAEAPSVTIGTLPSASSGLERVPPDMDLLTAQSIMQSKDYSQLAVAVGSRSLKGAISWESIARAQLYRDSIEKVRDAMDGEPVVVRSTDSLLEHVATIAAAGFVFVVDEARELQGIVTSSDLSNQFAQLANPFLLIGEIERRLRTAVDERFEADDLVNYVDPDESREIEGAEHLTFGEYVRLLQAPEAWARLGWRADRKVFCAHLDDVRIVRNSIMHFSTDPLGGEDLDAILRLLDWIKNLVARE